MIRNVSGLPPEEERACAVPALPAERAAYSATYPAAYSATYPAATQAILPNDLWSEVAHFLPRTDVLSLRTASTGMTTWVDRSLSGLHVLADNAPAMLAVIGRSAAFKHITALRISLCNNVNFPPAISALADLPHAKVHLELARNIVTSAPRDQASLDCLRTIQPASLSVTDTTFLSEMDARILADLRYPIILSLRNYRIAQTTALRMLASIPQLVSLHLETDEFDVAAAGAFRSHGRLLELYIESRDRIRLSDKAVELLAANSTLTTLRIGDAQAPLGEQALHALSENRTLRCLVADTHHHPLDASSALILSTNTCLKTLSISLRGGWAHLAHMTSLENLTLYGTEPIALGDAEVLSRCPHLKVLNLLGAPFAEGALAAIAATAVTDLYLSSNGLSAEEVAILLANLSLRKLWLNLTCPLPNAIVHTIALAAHPTLESLTVWRCGKFSRLWGEDDTRMAEPDFFRMMTVVERTALITAWGRHRPLIELKVDF